ncbi:MAG: hypothetical protein M1823_002151 [Watsoniomyces obsoletus]|nr:MAG: hypothetical protein M1823_002151 [Watsoniomyces obsoletus]
MPAVLPGKPQAKLQAVAVGQWKGQRVIAYISGNALVVLAGPHAVRQTIYVDDESSLEAVAFDEISGKIAVCSERAVHVYAIAEESLTSFKLANPVKLAAYSPDATLIASTGLYDKLVKIWRRLSFSFTEAQFEFAYLPHPTTVTNVRWRKSAQRQRTEHNVLYTICADNVFRIWTASNSHSLQILQLWGQVDLQDSIKPRLSSPQHSSSKRYTFVIDKDDFAVATERAVKKTHGTEKQHHALEHLLEVANRTPDVCVVLDEEGRMSAWGFENVGSTSRSVSNIFNIAHVDGVKLALLPEAQPQEDYVQMYAFADQQQDKPGLNILTHYFDGRIEWFETQVDGFFDVTPRKKRMGSAATWCGHAKPVEKMLRSISGKVLVSRPALGECLVWKQRHRNNTTSLALQSEIRESQPVQKVCILEDAHLVVLLHKTSISVWDTRMRRARQLARQPYQLEGEGLCLILLPQATTRGERLHIATISSELKGVAWEIRWPPQSDEISNGDGPSTTISEFCTFDLGKGDDLAFVIAVDPAGSLPAVSGFLDTFARDVAMSYTKLGTLHSWTARIDLDTKRVNWLCTSTVETGVTNPSLASGTSIRKAAVVDTDRTQLTIWNTRQAQLEFQSQFDHPIRDLDWTSTPDNQSILAVGFSHGVRLLSQLRYDYLDAGPAWTAIKEIRLSDHTPHPIGDSVWLSHGDLAIGAGNQLFVFEGTVDAGDTAFRELMPSSHLHYPMKLFDVVSTLNGQLPVFHPQFLAQCILRGKISLVQRTIIALNRTLKFYTEGDHLDSFLGIPVEAFLQGDESRSISNLDPLSSAGLRSTILSYFDFADVSSEDRGVTAELAASLNEKLTTIPMPQLSGQEQFHLADIIECVATVEKHHRSMDGNASRFLLSFRQHFLRKHRRTSSNNNANASLPWRDITWAYHSGSQDILVDLVSRQYHGRMQWEQARESGMFMWLSDHSALRAQFENIARNQYTRTEEKNPIDCSLFYLALKKKNVLMGLWRMATWNREQRATQKLLSNDFQEARWKTAALKNAYVLLGRHRYEYAAAFFLLADSLRDAVNICIERLDDLQLGIAIARVYEGDDGPVLREILEEQVLPHAAVSGNRWLATWAFWMLNRRDMAVRALISPVHTLLEKAESPGLQAKLYLADDPALVILYEQLREKTIQTLRVKNWEFLRQPLRTDNEQSFDPRQMLRRRSSLVVADLPPPTTPTTTMTSPKIPPEIRTGGAPGVGVGGTGTRKPPPQSVFEEPDANSLLANFGY